MRRLGVWFVLGILTLVVLPVDSRAAGRPDVILVTLDATRADRTGFSGAGSGLTPNLDRIAREGIVFSQAYSQSPLTVASHATVLTGTYPQTHHASELGFALPASLPYVPDLFHRAGYRTAAFVGSIELDPRNGPFQSFDRGFDVYDAGFHQPQRGESRYQSVARRGDEVVARATRWLTSNKQHPFFLWVNLHDPDGASGVSYDRAVAAADAAIGKVLNSLRSQALYEDAVLVFASAFGSSLGAHGEDTHGMFLYDETVHVPLLVRLPKSQFAGRQIKNRARLLDVAPTMLEAAGVPVPSQMQGQSLLRIARNPSQADQPSYARSERPLHGFHCSMIESWRAGKYLYIRSPKPELYDLTVDPGATHNLAQSSKATLETMAAQLQALDGRLANEPGKASSVLSSSELQKLASLGYVGLEKSGGGVNAATEGSDPKDFIGAANKTLGALSELEDGRPERAMSALKQVLASESNSYLAQFGMGSALFQLGQFADAIPYLHKAIELQPDSAWAHYTMGLCLLKTGDFKTAAVHLEIASGRLPAFSAGHSALAEAYAHLGRTQEAARERSGASPGERKKND